MEDRLERLLSKYWEGETSLDQEKEIKILLEQVEGFETEKKFFLGIKVISQVAPEVFEVKAKSKRSSNMWFKIAAALVVFLTVGGAIYRYQEQKAEKEAFLQVMQAFNMIQTNMQKGTESLNAMEEFKHLNATEEMFNINETKK